MTIPSEQMERDLFEAWLETTPDFAPEFEQHRAWANAYAWQAFLWRAARSLVPQQEGSSPPFGSRRAAALALYKPPFTFNNGYIFDGDHRMVADQDGFEGKVEQHIAARVRGWGRIGYLPDPEALQDEVGAVIAEALTRFWLAAAPPLAAAPVVKDET